MYSFFHLLQRHNSQTRAPIDTHRYLCAGGGGGGGGVTLICPYIGSGHFKRFKILNFNIFLWGAGGQKDTYFLDMPRK